MREPIPALARVLRRAGAKPALTPAVMAGAMVLAAAVLVAVPGAAQTGAGAVHLPDVSGLDRPQAEALIRELAEVNVITSNCPDWAISDSEWTLITATGDKLAAMLGLDPGAYDRKYYGPAFALLDDPGACARIGPKAPALIERLKAMGGTAPGA